MVTGIKWLAVRTGQNGKRSRDRIDETYYSWFVDLSTETRGSSSPHTRPTSLLVGHSPQVIRG